MNAPNPMIDAQVQVGVDPAQALTRNGFLDGRFELFQPKTGLRAGSDAMFLASAIPAKPGDTIVEAGVGTAAAALALLTRVAGTRVLGIENHPPHAALARKNAIHNDMADRLVVADGDIVTMGVRAMAQSGLAPPFDHAMANPPYHDPTQVRAGQSSSRAAAHMMPPGALAVWVENLALAVRDGGSVTFIHRAQALPELLTAMDRQLGAIHILPLVPRAGQAAVRVLVRGLRASNAPTQLLHPVPLHEADGSHTSQSDAILRKCEALDLDRLVNRP